MNRTHSKGSKTELEECGEHEGAFCDDHSCGFNFAGDPAALDGAIEALRRLPRHLALEAVADIPQLVLSSDAEVIHVIGCGDEVVANVRLAAAVGLDGGKVAQ